MQHQAKKRFGQNFLIDQNIVHKIVHSIDPKPGDLLVEIGPGLGALTRPLLACVENLHVIELDRDVIPQLETLDTDEHHLHIHQSDVLKFDFRQLLRDDNNKLRVAGNLPYNISTAVLFHLLQYRNNITDLHFMLQKEVVERIAATPGNHDYGRLSVMMQTWFTTSPLFMVSPQCFKPAPKVESAVIQLIPTDRYSKDVIDSKHYTDLVRQAFAQRRKTLKNTLKNFCTTEQIVSADIDPSIRAEQLTVEDFIRLHNCLMDA